MAIEQLEEPSPAEDWLDRLATQVEKTFGVPGISPSTVGGPSALDAVADLLGHMFNDILLT